MNTKHTPTPWAGGHYSSIVGCPVVGQGGQVICNTAIGHKPHRESAEANAAFIVRACNAHEALVLALKAAELRLNRIANEYASADDIEADPEAYGGTDDGDETVRMVYENMQADAAAGLKAVRAALAKAEAA